MTTSTSQFPPDSYGYLSSKTSSSQTSCNICKRLLYSFEEILLCRVCHGSYHRRCLKNEPFSRYGQYENFTCESCQLQTSSPSATDNNNNNNNNNKTRENDSDEFDSDHSPIKTPNGNHTKSFEQIQSHLTTKVSDLDDYLPISPKKQNGQYHDDTRTSSSQIQQEQHDLDSDEDNYEKSTMFQANYQYTPLKDYAASKSQLTNYPTSPTSNSNQLPKPSYGGGLQYSDHGYDPTLSRAVDAPSLHSNQYSSPTVDNLSLHNRQQNYISTTSFTVNEKPVRQQNNSQLPARTFVHSHSPQIREKSFSQSQLDRYSTTGSDSGIGTTTSNSQNHSRSQQDQLNESPQQEIIDEKLTNLVQQLGKQFELDTKKLNERFENKLKDLENMIHQQTFIIQRQDQVIDDLKKQILHIENERDVYRQRLSLHEQPDEYPEETVPSNQIEQNQHTERKPSQASAIVEQNQHMERKASQASTVIEQNQNIGRKVSQASTVTSETSKASTKKNPAPRVESQRIVIYDERSPTVSSKPIKQITTIRKREDSSSSSASSTSISSIAEKLASAVPVVEPPPASNRLDHIINQSPTKELTTPSLASYSLPQIRRQDRPHFGEPISMEQQQVVTSVHFDDSDDEQPTKDDLKSKRSNSTSSSSSIQLPTSTTKTNSTKTKPPTNLIPHKFPSFETLQESFQTDQAPRLSNKTASLQFGTKPMRDEDAGSIHLTPVESNYPANQANCPVKGWLRKQNRESFLKRIERFYCVLTNNALLMHRHEQDRTPQKAINLRGAKVYYYDDSKYGPSLELTWSSLAKDEKHYHLYAPNPQEAEQWVKGIQTVIHNLENRISGNFPKSRYP